MFLSLPVVMWLGAGQEVITSSPASVFYMHPSFDYVGGQVAQQTTQLQWPWEL